MSGRSRVLVGLVVAAVGALIVVASTGDDDDVPEPTAAERAAERARTERANQPAFAMTAPLFEANWLETRDAKCPEGTRMRGAPPPGGNEIWCARPDGTRHGQHIHWQSNGRKAFERRYQDGTLHGYWAEWQISGKPWTVGLYKHGERHGRWMRWNRDRTVRVTEYEDGIRLGEKIVDESELGSDGS